MLISPAEQENIRVWNGTLERPVTLTLHATGDPRTRDLESFAHELTKQADRVRLTAVEDDSANPPAFGIGSGWFYHGLPQGRELDPFLRILSHGDGSVAPVPASVQEYLQRVTRPATLELYVNPHCVHCPFVVNALAPLPFCNSNLRVELFDLQLFPELAQQRGIKAVPVVLLGDRFRWTGPLQVQEVLNAVARDRHADPDAEMMVRMLKEGAADRLASMMLERAEIFADFPDVVVHAQWSVRLAAMVVLEMVADADRALARSVLPCLWRRRDSLDRTPLGDLIYLTGELGDAGWVETIQSVLDGESDSELVEAGREAISNLSA